MVALKLMTLNTGNSRLLGGLLAIIRIENRDILFLQELTLTSGQLKLFVAKFGYSAEANTNLLDITELGTGMIWKSLIPVSDVTSVVQSRIQMAKLGPYTLLNIYAPSGSNHRQERRDFFGQDIFNLVRGSSSYPLIAGDFNCVLSAQDTERNFSDKKCPALTDLVRGFNYADAFRIVKPNAVEFTFHRPNCAASRLDRFYVPQYLLPHVQDVHHHASLADHHFGILELELTSLESVSAPPRSKQLYWKLNTNILHDEDFMENFSDLYNKVKSEMTSYEDIASWWDCVAKPAFKLFCMDVSERLSYIRKNTKMYLFSYLGLVIRKGNWKEVARVRKEIKTMLEKESMGFVVRSRYKESIESEKASVFHLNRENKKYKKNSSESLKINGEVINDESKIEAEVLKFFGALFNGHHDRNGEDTGQPFVPDYTDLPDFLVILPN